MSFGRLVTALALLALAAAPSAPAKGSQSIRKCPSYPTPGSIAPTGTNTPADLVAEYSVLGRRQRSADRLTPAAIGRKLSASGVVMSGTRFLAVTPSAARVYLVPAEHFLTLPLPPDRCVRPDTHHALCLVTPSAGHSRSTCSAAPGTVAPFVYGPGNPGFGLVPNGVPQVVVHYVTHPSLDLAVHRNFYVVNTLWPSGATPCGLDWVDHAIVLRMIKSCKPVVDTS